MSGEIDRKRRVAELIKRELAGVIFSEIGDPRVGSITITGVDISRDFKNATVFVTQLGKQSDDLEFVDVLNHAASFIRHKLSHRTEMRTTPSLRFKFDASIERGVSLSKLIDDACANPVSREPGS